MACKAPPHPAGMARRPSGRRTAPRRRTGCAAEPGETELDGAPARGIGPRFRAAAETFP
jgi:hypothetical protein